MLTSSHDHLLFPSSPLLLLGTPHMTDLPIRFLTQCSLSSVSSNMLLGLSRMKNLGAHFLVVSLCDLEVTFGYYYSDSSLFSETKSPWHEAHLYG